MAPNIPKTIKHKPERTQVGEQVLDLVIPYVHNVADRNSLSLVSRKSYEIDGITRKRVTLHTHYYPNPPASLSKRFPFIESLTLKGHPSVPKCNVRGVDSSFLITPWIEQLALEFRCLKQLHICCFIVHDEDLEILARTRGKDLRSLKIKKCRGLSTDGLSHVSKYCNQLRTLCLVTFIETKDGIWLNQLALNNTVLERLHVKITDASSSEDLTLLAKNCCNSLISLKIGACYLSKLRDAFRYAVRLEHFGGYICSEERGLVDFRLPPNMRALSLEDFPVTRYLFGLPFLNHIRKLKLEFFFLNVECECLLFKRCPNLEVLYTKDECGDKGLQVIGKFCKKLRKLTHNRLVTHVGLISLAKGCTNLESLEISLENISNEAIECIGTHLKNLRKFRILVDNDRSTDRPLDNGIMAMLIGCGKLERLYVTLWHGGLTDVGLEYIGKYGANLRSLSLTCIGNTSAGLIKLSEGCPKLQNLKLRGCTFSKEALTSFVFNMPSLRYVWFASSDCGPKFLILTRPEFQL